MMTSLEALRRFDAAHRDAVRLSHVGLSLLDPLEDPWSDETPRNSLVFATTGGDSVHFCVLDPGEGAAGDAPVVMVVPCNTESPRLFVGESLHEFLALGSVIGFSHLEQLTYDREEALRYLFDWEAFVRHCYFGEPPPKEDLAELAASRALLRSLSEEFSLAPWPDANARLAQLQFRWTPRARLAR